MSEPTPLPTNAELEILHVLWERGPSTVREVLDRTDPERGIGYTTVLKLMQIMHGKGLVERHRDGRQHVYRAVETRAATETRLVEELAGRAFGGSLSRLALRALAEPLDEKEMTALRALLEER